MRLATFNTVLAVMVVALHDCLSYHRAVNPNLGTSRMIRYPFDDSTSEEDFGPSVGSLLPASTLSAPSSARQGLSARTVSSTSIGTALTPTAPSPVATTSTAATVATTGTASADGATAVGGGLAGVTKWFWLDETAEENVIKKKVPRVCLDICRLLLFVLKLSFINVHVPSHPLTNNLCFQTGNELELHEDTDDRAVSRPGGRTPSHNNGNSAMSMSGARDSNDQGYGSYSRDSTYPPSQYSGGQPVLTQRAVEVVSAAAAQVVAELYRPGSELAEGGCRFLSQHQYTAWQNFQQICSLNFGVKVTFLSVDEDPSGTSRRAVLYGTAEALAQVSDLLRQATRESQQQTIPLSNETKKLIVALRNRQSVVMTQDWRFQPDVSSAEMSNSGKSAQCAAANTAFDAYVAQHLLAQPVVEGYLAVASLPVGVCAMSPLSGPSSSTVGSTIEVTSETVRRSLLSHMQGLTARLGYTTQASVQAHALLVRYLRFVPVLAVKDSLAILAAVAVLVAKCGADFKYKQVPQIVHSAYCQVFNRDESTVEVSSVQPYLGACLDREHAVYAATQRDVFSPDIVPIMQSFLRASMYRHRWYFDHSAALNAVEANGGAASNGNGSAQKDKHRDREAEHARRKQIAAFQQDVGVRCTVRRTVLSVAEGLVQELLCLRTTAVTNGSNGVGDTSSELSSGSALALNAVPVELLQMSALLLVCHLCSRLPSGTAHNRIAAELEAFSAELAGFAAKTLHLSIATVLWCVELIAETCIEYLPSLDYLEPFRELRETLTVVEAVQLLRESLPADVEASLNSAAADTGSGVTPPATASTAQGTGTASSVTAAAGFAVSRQSVPSSQPSSTTAATAAVNGPCRTRFPWLVTDTVSTAAGENGQLEPSAVYIETGVGWVDIKDGRCSTGGVMEGQSNEHVDVVAVECAKVANCLVMRQLFLLLLTRAMCTFLQDLYFSFASTRTDAAKFLPRLECSPASRTANGAGDRVQDVGLMSLRSWPSRKFLEK
jgi:hypothetical protein